MMKKKIATRVLAALLALFMLPAFSASAAGDATLVRADAVGVFTGEEKTVFLLESGDRYYISPTEAGTLTGLRPATAVSGATEFYSDHLRYRPELSDIESVSYKEDTYYALEPLMDALETYVFSNGNGYLYYNSVPENTELLLGKPTGSWRQSTIPRTCLKIWAPSPTARTRWRSSLTS
jgi:hypothetical protein